MSNVTLTATEFVAALGHSLDDWALGTDWTDVVFGDGTGNALGAAARSGGEVPQGPPGPPGPPLP